MILLLVAAHGHYSNGCAFSARTGGPNGWKDRRICDSVFPTRVGVDRVGHDLALLVPTFSPHAWGWTVELLTDREALRRGFRTYQAEREQENEPLRARLSVVDDLLAANRTQLELLLDLYLAGDFPRETLTDRKVRLEKTISALEEERAGLVARLQAGTLTEGQIQSLEDFVARVAQGLDVMEDDFDTKRRVIEALGLEATLSVEQGHKAVSARCVVGEKSYILRPAESLL